MRGRRLLLAIFFLSFGSAASAKILRAGAATTDITPPTGFPLWGYAARHDSPSVGVAHPLLARAVVLDDGERCIALVSLDLGRPPTREHTAAIRARAITIGVHDLFLVASHTHHGPVLELDDWPTPDNSYTKQLDQKLGDLIRQALSQLKPARLGTATRPVDLNRNRQSKRPDAPTDDALRVVRVDDDQGRPMAVIADFAAHPTLTPSRSCEITPDYPGYFARKVERELRVPCLFLQGASGDLSPKLPPGRSGAEGYGDALADEVIAMVTNIKPAARATPIKSRRETLQFACRMKLDDPLVKIALGQAFFPKLVDAYANEYKHGVRPEITVATLGESLGLVGFSGEMFCGHALSLRRRARMEQVLIFGCCNDYQQYFPTIEAASEGGYGTSPPVANAELGAGERMTDAALISLYRLRGQVP